MGSKGHGTILKILLMFLSGLFLFDVMFLHYLIPWMTQSTDSVNQPRFRLSMLGDYSQRSDQSKAKKDTRSRSTFKEDLIQLAGHVRKIPTIIHQTWNTEEIPEIFHKWIITWKEHNPQWEYRFWTLKEIRRFVLKEFPEFVKLYDTYTEDIFRFDVMRYLVLYKYGGIYVDLDMEALKPLDNWTYNFNCIVSEETYEHPFIVREAEPPANILNGFIACRPRHPFLKLAIESLEEFAGFYFGNYLHATGPFFFNAILERYLVRLTNDSSLRIDTDDVTILPPRYFFPTYDPSESDIITERCFPGKYQLLQEPAQMTCKELLKTFLKRTPVTDSYTDHHWLHAYMFHPDWKKKNTKHIKEIEPSAIIEHV